MQQLLPNSDTQFISPVNLQSQIPTLYLDLWKVLFEKIPQIPCYPTITYCTNCIHVYVTEYAIKWKHEEWLFPFYCYVMQHRTRNYDGTNFIWIHPDFPMKIMKSSFPPCKRLFNNYSCPFMCIIVYTCS